MRPIPWNGLFITRTKRFIPRNISSTPWITIFIQRNSSVISSSEPTNPLKISFIPRNIFSAPRNNSSTPRNITSTPRNLFSMPAQRANWFHRETQSEAQGCAETPCNSLQNSAKHCETSKLPRATNILFYNLLTYKN